MYNYVVWKTIGSQGLHVATALLKAFSQIRKRDVKCLLSCKQAVGETLYLHHFSQGGK